ncbi:MAG: FosX/FosE/FosI family fosfomycin resistance hydrolase [Defluviitaleaceae bacterium]|nr:FosX/FosE/FosI family fosfomycin resistance hydrolase [Defluviitaleaceae bacterium]
MISISHITLTVRDLEHSSEFYKKIFQAKEIYSSGENTFSIAKEKFFLIGEIWLCLMQGEQTIPRTYNHIAFQIKESDLNTYAAKIKQAGAEIKPTRPRIPGEGRSIYFYDLDNHLFELHTGTLQERLAAYSTHNNM